MASAMPNPNFADKTIWTGDGFRRFRPLQFLCCRAGCWRTQNSRFEGQRSWISSPPSSPSVLD